MDYSSILFAADYLDIPKIKDRIGLAVKIVSELYNEPPIAQRQPLQVPLLNAIALITFHARDCSNATVPNFCQQAKESEKNGRGTASDTMPFLVNPDCQAIARAASLANRFMSRKTGQYLDEERRGVIARLALRYERPEIPLEMLDGAISASAAGTLEKYLDQVAPPRREGSFTGR